MAGKVVAVHPSCYKDLPHRGISKEICQKFKYGTDQDGNEYEQYFRDGVVFAQKKRTPTKDFYTLGDSKDLPFFGSHLWNKGRKIVVTEGAIDAMSVAEIQDGKWPVVSIAQGASSAAKEVARQLEYLEKFDEVIFMFDTDKPGRKAAKECAALLKPQHAFIAELPLKDANEMLLANRRQEVINAIWNAEPYRPDGIVGGSELYELMVKDDNEESLFYPWGDLQRATGGMHFGTVVTLVAGTGVGKSTACKELAAHVLQEGERVGYVALEESSGLSGRGILGVLNSKPWMRERPGEQELKEAYEALDGRLWTYNHFGSTGKDNLIAKIRYLTKGLGCRLIILDHLHMAISGIMEGDERRLIDNMMTDLKCLAQESEACIIVVSHIRKASSDQKSAEDGGQISLKDLRGSNAIAQLSDDVIALERASSEGEHETKLRVLKCRLTGTTGPCGTLVYNPETGRMTEMGTEEIYS